MHTLCLRLVSFTLLWLCFPVAHADFERDPTEACAFLAEARLDAGGYRRIGEGLYQCRSRRRNLPLGGGRTQHMLRYLAHGDEQIVRQLRLILFINSTSQVQAAHQRLLRYARMLVKNALGVDLPEGAANAILKIATGTWNLNDAELVLQQGQVRTGSYEYRLIIR
jgi:hypothetical protein